MRITGVESTSLFAGTIARPLQIIRVTVESDGPAQTGTITVGGARARTEDPFRISVPGPGESRTFEVPVLSEGAPGVSRPVTVTGETSGGSRVSVEATVTVAEPGWTMWMVSHFHYDPVWWSTQGQFTEARLVLPGEDGDLPAVRTAFELVTLHLEKARRDSDYKFVLAEVDYLKPYFDAFPGERAFLRRLFAEGRCELVGGTYNEPNTNLTGAELTIRNAVYGIGYQRDVLGADPRSAWMLDAFGFDPGFPGLMAAAGLTSSSWARGPFHQWGPDSNPDMQFPAEFEWISPDGTGLLTSYMANHYGAGWGPLHEAGDIAAAEAAACQQFTELAPVAATRNVMLPVGADHVLPARWVTDVHRSWNERYTWPRFVTAIPRDYFDAVRAETAPGAAPSSGLGITPQSRDMNPVYTGKDVSYIDTKQASRAGEIAVSEGERFATLAWLRGAPYPAGSLDKAWRQLAYGAHHDAITGTESDQVYLDLLSGWKEAWQRGDDTRRAACAFLAEGPEPAGSGPANAENAVTVFNGLARERDGMVTATVTFTEPGPAWVALADGSGAEVPALAENVNRHPDGSLASADLTFRATGVPGLGSRQYTLRAVPAPGTGPGWTDVPGTAIENDRIAVTADPARGGALTSVTDKRTGRDALTGPGNELVLQEEYAQHPRWGEGPWHLSPKGPGTGSASRPADSVRAQRSPAGSRLVADFTLGDLSVRSETILWDGSDRVEFRTRVSGSIGSDRLLRVRFPADVPGGRPVYQTATAVIGRPFGAPEADTAVQWWTLDNPAHQWFGAGSVAAVSVPGSSADGETGGRTRQAIGVAEVVCPGGTAGPGNVRDLVVSLAQAGVTATSSRADGPRYGAVDLDSNLPDFRIALGGPDDNAFTAAVLDAAGPEARKRLAELAAEQGSARLWVPAARPLADAVAPEADLRGPRDLPVLIVAGSGGLEPAVEALRADLATGTVPADAAAGLADGTDDPAALGDGTVALFNAGTPSAAVTPDGTLWMALMRACSAWPSGVWIDGDPRTAPDGSSFAWQHWSHTFAYALAVTGGDWREAGFNAAAEDYNHALTAIVSGVAAGSGGPAVSVGAPNVSLSALKPRGNPLAAGRLSGAPAAGREVTVRLRETDGRPASARLRIAPGIEAAWRTDLLEDETLSPLGVHDGTATVKLGPFETVTLAARVADTGAPAGAPAAPAGIGEDEPVRPPYARYWLHGTGAAPAGNLPVTVTFTPPRATLQPGTGQPGTEERLRLTVACGPEPASGYASLALPAGIGASVAGGAGGEPADAAVTLPYDLPGHGHVAWDLTLRAEPDTAGGRYFVTAAIADDSGHSAEDAALVTVGEPGPPERDLPADDLFLRMMTDTQAQAAEADVSFPGVPDPAAGVALRPGERGRLRVRVANRLASELRGAAQLISPFGSWEGTPSWVLPVTAAAGAETEIVFDIAVPAGAAPGWESWLLVKLSYFGRVRYSPSVRLAAG